MSALSRPEFHDEAKAFAHLESIVWADGKVCPHCGAVDRLTKVTANPAKRIREGLWRCGHCKGQFTAKVGTVFEHARIPLHKMLQAVYLMTASKKGISAHQLHRVLEITYKSAWFLAHRIREAMVPTNSAPLGGPGHIVEADETYFGRDKNEPTSRLAIHHMNKIFSLVDRTTGRSSSVVFSGPLTSANIGSVLLQRVDRASRLHTDEAKFYKAPGAAFAAHETVNHRLDEYARGDVTTNTVEGFFSIFKRGMRGVYQHCGQQHLHRYLAEFDFRYTHRVANGCNDADRTRLALRGIAGKRLTYNT
jgi:transposase-like protein